VTATQGEPRAAAGACTPAEIAWLALLPCAALTLAAIVLLGPLLGEALLAPRGMAFLPTSQQAVLPEPTEHARYLLALVGPPLLAGVVLLSTRRPPTPPSWVRARLVPTTQALLVAFLVACLWVEHTTAFEPATGPTIGRRTYFTPATLAAAGVIALALVIIVSRPATLRRGAALLRDTPGRRAAAIGIAVLLLAAWLLTAVNSDATIGAAFGVVGANVSIWIDEAAAVLNGRPPLVDLHAQYAQLWPYLSAAAMELLGSSVTVFVGTMIAGTFAAMLAVFALLRRVAHSWLIALALFAPFVATSFFKEAGPLENRYGPTNLFSLFPMRYGGAYVLAWLVVRHVDGAHPHRRALLFLVAGLVTINNVEFGLPALGATLAALLLAAWPDSWAKVGRLTADVVLGLAGAVAATAALTLAVGGALPRFGFALTFARMFGIEGFGMLPMRVVGFHLALYATFAAAIGAAAVEVAHGRRTAPLTAALMWSGVFGLGAGGYYAGRSHPEVLIGLFSAWALALALLMVVVVRDAATAQRWRLSPAVLALFAAAGLTVCSLAQTPTPWSQLERLSRSAAQVLHPLAQERAIAAQTEPGEPVAILAPVGHRIADDIGIVDVTPYSDTRMIAAEQLDATIRALRAAGGTKVILQDGSIPPEAAAQLAAAGFRATQAAPEAALQTLVDMGSAGG
jgi:hypothetical protein